MCGAKILFEGEFTLVARTRITAWGKWMSAPGGSGNVTAYSGVLSLPAYAAVGVQSAWTLCDGGRR